MKASLDLGVVGNCTYGALIDSTARVVWCCLPRFDGDPVFCSLLDDRHEDPAGTFSVEIDGFDRSEQAYLRNTAVLVTRLHDRWGGGIEITDFAPRFVLHGRGFRPMTLVRRVRPIAGTPRICIKLRPRFDYGATRPELTRGTNHVRYVGPRFTLRLTTNAPLTYLARETPFLIEEPLSLILGPDETLAGGVEETARDFQERTVLGWRRWVRHLALPMQWQEAVIRAAITLKLCAY